MVPLVFVLRGVLQLSQHLLPAMGRRPRHRRLAHPLFAHLQNLSVGFYTQLQHGRFDVPHQLGHRWPCKTPSPARYAVIVQKTRFTVSLVAFCLWQEPKLTLITMLAFPYASFPSSFSAAKCANPSRRIQDSYAELTPMMTESFTGNRIIKAYNLEKSAVEQFSDISRRSSATA